MRLALLLASLVALTLAAAPAHAGDDVSADLEACRELVRKRSWKRGREAYEKLLVEHEGNPLLIGERLAIEDDLQLCLFNVGRREPSGEELFGPAVKKYSSSSRRVELIFPKGTDEPLWEKSGDDLPRLPIRFDDALEVVIPAEGRKAPGEHRVRVRAVLAMDPDQGGGYLMVPSWKFRSGYDTEEMLRNPRMGIPDHSRIFRISGDGSKLLAEEYYSTGKYRREWSTWTKLSHKGTTLKIEVDRAKSLAKRDSTYSSGYVWVTASWERLTDSMFGEAAELPEGSPSIAIKGTVDRVWLDKRIAQLEDEAFRVWREKEYDRDAVLPEWLRAETPATSAFAQALPSDVPAERAAEVRAFLDRAWARDIEQPLEELVRMGAVSPHADRLLRAVLLWLAGAPVAAEDALTIVADAAPDLATPLRFRAAARLDRRAYDEVLADVDALLALTPDDPAAYELRAGVHLRRGDLDAAAATFVDARTAGAWTEDLESLAQAITSARRGPQWKTTYRKQSRNFDVFTDHSQAMAQDIANELEQAVRIYSRFFRQLPAERREARVYVFSSRDAYLAYAKELGAGLAHSAGAYLPRLGVLVIWMPVDRADFFATIRHEGFHQYVHNFAENLPLWFNEGYAEHFGNSDLARGRVEADEVAFRYTKRVAAARANFVPVPEFMRMPRGEFMAGAAVHYVQAWALVRFLVETKDDELRGLLAPYFERLVAGASPDEAYTDVFEPHEKLLVAQFKIYIYSLDLDR